MNSATSCVLITALLVTTFALTPRTASAATPKEVETAIKKAREFLYSEMKEGTRWEPDPARKGGAHEWNKGQGSTWGGWTALCTYALLASGESPQDPRIAKAVEFLTKADMVGVYGIGLRAQVWNLVPTSDAVRKAKLTDLELLSKGVVKNGPYKGLYGYSIVQDSPHNSPSQYGVLGMWALEQVGAEIPNDYWKTIDATWRSHQEPDGGWTYTINLPPPPPPAPAPARAASSSSMTAAGVATLFITQDYLHASDGSACKGNITNPNIDAGMKWMAKNFSPNWAMYDLYGVERIGVASGYKYFGDKDWYQLGAERLVRTQQANGSWPDGGTGGLSLTNSAFALVFLSRGSAPIVMNKLSYDVGGKEGNWNQRPRDVANFVKWAGKTTEHWLNWQIVNLKAPVDELHDAPILYIAGNQELKFEDPDKQKLKQFVEGGGLILGNSDCATASFNASFQKLGEELFAPQKFRELPEGHPIYKNQNYQRSTWRTKPSVLGLSNGSRELMLLVPQTDPAKTWQLQQQNREEPYQLAANIFLYAVDKQELRTKGDTYILKPDPAIKADRVIKVARLKYDGNWDPEPGGWRRLAAYLHNKFTIDLTTEAVPLGEGKLTGFKVAHLTGTDPFKLKDAQRKELKTFVAGGGTLIVDAAGGNSDFAESAKAELDASIGDTKELGGEPLKPTHAIYNLVGSQITEVSYRAFARQNVVGRLRGPQIRGQSVGADKRTGVYFSREDLSTGMVGEPVDGIIGYSPASATALIGNIVLVASGEGKMATTAPAAPATNAPTAPAKQ